MTNKIDSGIAAATRPAASHPSSGIERAGSQRNQPVGAVPAADQVRLTGEATALHALQREMGAEPGIDLKKVESVRAALEAGSYRINPEAIATSLIAMERDLG